MPDDTNDDETGEREYPAVIDETRQGHPPEEWSEMYDEPDPNAGKVDYPDDINDDAGDE
mgnify:CR=1 FL=1